MAQRLTLPLNNMMLQAGYKNPVYKEKWGWNHFGVDATSPNSRNVYGMGEGEVVAAGQDGATLTGPNSRLGNVLVIVYRNVETNTGKLLDLVCRMYHLDTILVKVGDRVSRNTVVARYGNTGANTTGAHLHVEFDTDTKWPTLAPGVSVGSGKIINTAAAIAAAGGTCDSTIAPDDVWYVGNGQQIGSDWLGSWVAIKDTDVPEPEEAEGPNTEFLLSTIEAYEAEREEIIKAVKTLAALLGVE